MATLLLTDALAAQLADAVRSGLTLEVAAQASGVSPQQVQQWVQVADRLAWPDGTPVRPESLERIKAFAALIARARAEREAEAVKRIREAAATVGKSGVLEWRADAWYLEHAPSTRDRWAQKIEVEQTGTQLHEHRLVREVATQGISALDDAERALLAEHPALSADTL